MINKKIFIFALSLVLTAQGCATLKIQSFRKAKGQPNQALHFYRDLDREITKTQTRNSADFPVKGFPYLRSNRFLTKMKDHLRTDEQRKIWVQEMMALDIKKREKEIKNLPKTSLKALSLASGETFNRESLLEALNKYANEIYAQDRSQPDFYKTLSFSVRDRSEYSILMRAAGLYPIYSLPVALGTVIVYDEFRAWHKTPLDELEMLGELKSYAPTQNKLFSELALERMFDDSRRDELDIIRFTPNELEQLAFALAPVFVQDVVADYDKMGQLVWRDGQVTLDIQKPTVYYYTTHTYIKGRPTLQINYAVWYLARSQPAPWIEHGPLDGLTYRVTLDHDGRPIMADIMNNCGCYHLYFPNSNKLEKIIPTAFEFDPLAPEMLPEEFPGKQLHMRINSGWHQVQKLYTVEDNLAQSTYDLVPYDVLEVLPKGDGTTESVFNNIGIMKNSTRIEPVFFFPMGIYDIGYMRQRGHHATKLIGEAHFTDADFFDANFIFK